MMRIGTTEDLVVSRVVQGDVLRVGTICANDAAQALLPAIGREQTPQEAPSPIQ